MLDLSGSQKRNTRHLSFGICKVNATILLVSIISINLTMPIELNHNRGEASSSVPQSEGPDWWELLRVVGQWRWKRRWPWRFKEREWSSSLEEVCGRNCWRENMMMSFHFSGVRESENGSRVRLGSGNSSSSWLRFVLYN